MPRKEIQSTDFHHIKLLEAATAHRYKEFLENPSRFFSALESLTQKHAAEVDLLNHRISELELQVNAFVVTTKVQAIATVIKEIDQPRWVALGLANKCTKCGMETKWSWHDGLNSRARCRPACIDRENVTVGLPADFQRILQSLENDDDESF